MQGFEELGRRIATYPLPFFRRVDCRKRLRNFTPNQFYTAKNSCFVPRRYEYFSGYQANVAFDLQIRSLFLCSAIFFMVMNNSISDNFVIKD